MTGLAESSAPLLFDKAQDVWQTVCFVVIRLPHLLLNVAQGLCREVRGHRVLKDKRMKY